MTQQQADRQQVWQSRVDPEFRHSAPQVLRQFPEARDYNPVEEAAAIHLYVRKIIDYEARDFGNSPRDLRLPDECLRVGAGNCQEKVLLTASLLKAIHEIEVRTLGLSREDKRVGHRVLEIRFPYHPDDVCDVLDGFYDRTPHVSEPPLRYGYSHYRNQYLWMVADPGEDCLGELGHLRRLGYVVDTEGAWDWHRVDDTYEL